MLSERGPVTCTALATCSHNAVSARGDVSSCWNASMSVLFPSRSALLDSVFASSLIFFLSFSHCFHLGGFFFSFSLIRAGMMGTT